MTVYAVTGASGHLGRLAVQQLLSRGVLPSDVVAVVRSQAAVADLVACGVQVREADYSQPDTIEPRAAAAAPFRVTTSTATPPGTARTRNALATGLRPRSRGASRTSRGNVQRLSSCTDSLCACQAGRWWLADCASRT